ncbi:cyclase [Rhizoctonia solani]|uniref:Cyclase n=1 Tax=Rhizoctonia solani TaxID=456999 RepID=A0A8H8PAA3_9AGAM|nr:cyclase [Rhizoctonia solani]QRW27172.1 cyclase [Rhizoctonia solani]
MDPTFATSGTERNRLPAFKDLPLKPEYPPHAAWGVWGEKDELGTVNNITPETIAAASKEIKLGMSIPLNWAMDQPTYPFYDRKGFHQEHIAKTPRIVNDDIIHFNTQCSSQWDSLRHFGYQAEKVFYNGLKQETLLSDPFITTNGIHNWAKTGIVGRGVLLDFYAYAQRHNLNYDPFSQHGASLDQIKAVQAEQGVEIRGGDILLIRFGFIAQYTTLSDERKREVAKVPHTWAGMEQSKEFLEWFWDNRFAALAGDTPAFEMYPPRGDFMLHPFILSGFGCPLGEMFDLERLAKECAAAQRWSFFFTSAPLNIPGGVASPPNAIAIFKRQHMSAGSHPAYEMDVFRNSNVFMMRAYDHSHVTCRPFQNISELSTIILAGMMGQYAFAVFWGAIIDSIGPHACSLAASALFLFSWSTFAYLVANSLGSPTILAALFFTAGVGRVASYFSSIFASRSKKKSGLATSVPLALSGLSPLVLSYVAGPWILGICSDRHSYYGHGGNGNSKHGHDCYGIPGHAESVAAAQVRFISIAGTLAKLCTGPLADWICPPVDEGPTLVCWCGPVRPDPKKGMNRMLIPAMCLTILASVYAYTAVCITSADQLWILSVGTGLAYGASWAVLPSITSVIWGARNLGRNFGILSYAPLVGTPIFTYVYAWTSEEGRDWRMMFLISVASVAAALVWCGMLWRRWSGLL